MSGFVGVKVIGCTAPQYTILIDDEQITQMNWESAARESGKHLKLFSSPGTFFPVAKHLSKKTPIYIDSHLGGNVRGELVAKDIYSMGFHEIHLTTGYSADDFTDMPWLKGVRGKQPPWSPAKERANETS